jgi:hypothetical protein
LKLLSLHIFSSFTIVYIHFDPMPVAFWEKRSNFRKIMN